MEAWAGKYHYYKYCQKSQVFKTSFGVSAIGETQKGKSSASESLQEGGGNPVPLNIYSHDFFPLDWPYFHQGIVNFLD